jgi:hypothetical protein
MYMMDVKMILFYDVNYHYNNKYDMAKYSDLMAE